MQWQRQHAPQHAAHGGHHQGFQQEGDIDAPGPETQHAERADLACAAPHRGVHRVHGGEGRANAHDRRQARAEYLDRRRRLGLLAEVFRLGERAELHLFVVLDSPD